MLHVSASSSHYCYLYQANIIKFIETLAPRQVLNQLTKRDNNIVKKIGSNNLISSGFKENPRKYYIKKSASFPSLYAIPNAARA